MTRLVCKILIFVLVIPGCSFYSFKGSLPAHIHSITIASVTNESAEFAAAEILNEELNQLMVEENILDIVLPEEAESSLNVVIKSVTDKPYTVTLSGDLGVEQVEEWKISIKALITWYDITRDEILFEKQISNWGAYSTGVDISTDGIDNDGDNLIDGDDSDEIGSPRESALNISVRRLSQDIVNQISSTW